MMTVNRVLVPVDFSEHSARALDFRAEVAVAFGDRYREILNYVKRASIDVIVMGTHGRSGVSHALMGSVAEKVVRTAPCPVLTVC